MLSSGPSDLHSYYIDIEYCILTTLNRVQHHQAYYFAWRRPTTHLKAGTISTCSSLNSASR